MTKRKGIITLALVAAFSIGFGTWGVLYLLGQIQQGRSDAIRITCAVEAAISQAGGETIDPPALARQKHPTPFERRLEGLGYPSLAVRQAQARFAAKAYSRSIDRRVVQAVGAEKARGVVLPGGRINCEQLLRLARTH